MGVRTQVEITCDFSECKGSKNGPSVVQYNKEDTDSGKVPVPEEAKYLVIFNHNGVLRSFCCQLCAARYFLPPGHEIKQKVVVPIDAFRSGGTPNSPGSE